MQELLDLLYNLYVISGFLSWVCVILLMTFKWPIRDYFLNSIEDSYHRNINEKDGFGLTAFKCLLLSLLLMGTIIPVLNSFLLFYLVILIVKGR